MRASKHYTHAFLQYVRSYGTVYVLLRRKRKERYVPVDAEICIACQSTIVGRNEDDRSFVWYDRFVTYRSLLKCVCVDAMSRERAMSMKSCVVCCENMTTFAVGSCGHRVSCPNCTLKNRICHKNIVCMICKEKSDCIIITNDPNASYEELSARSGEPIENGIRADRGMNVDVYVRLCRRRCPICVAECEEKAQCFSTNANLYDHALKNHGKMFCMTCLRERKVFYHNQRLYTEEDLKRHYREGDPPVGDEGAIEPHKRANAARNFLRSISPPSRERVHESERKETPRYRSLGDAPKTMTVDRRNCDMERPQYRSLGPDGLKSKDDDDDDKKRAVLRMCPQGHAWKDSAARKVFVPCGRSSSSISTETVERPGKRTTEAPRRHVLRKSPPTSPKRSISAPLIYENMPTSLRMRGAEKSPLTKRIPSSMVVNRGLQRPPSLVRASSAPASPRIGDINSELPLRVRQAALRSRKRAAGGRFYEI